MKEEKGIIVCAFPATGKTWAIGHASDLDLRACDSDSEDYHWADRNVLREKRIERENWISVYVDHLIAETTRQDIVFCSTHQEVRNELVRRGISFMVVYPTANQKKEYINRVTNRTTGLCGKFGIKLMTESWDTWLTGMTEQSNCKHVVLQPGQYLTDVLEQITG